MNWAWATSLDQLWRSPAFPMWLTLAAAGFFAVIVLITLLRAEKSVANGALTVIVNDAACWVNFFLKQRIFIRHFLVLVGKDLQIEELCKYHQEHPTKDEAYDITARLIED